MRNVPFDDSSESEHRQSLREQVLAEFDRKENSEPACPWWKHALIKGTEIMRRPIPRLIAVTAACLAIAAVWTFVPGGQTTAQAFNKLATAIVEAKSAKFEMEVEIQGQPKQTIQALFLAPGKYRQELPGAVNIVDLKAGKIMNVIASQKKVMIMNIKGEQKGQSSQDYFERLRELLAKSRDGKDEQYKPIGKKEIDGKQAVGFRLDSPAATVTLWGDAATGNPVRIESLWSGLPLTEVSMSHFEVDVDVKESLFDMTPPEGYKVQSIDVDASPYQEKDLVAAFATACEMDDGQFPDSVDTTGVMKLVIKFGMKRGGDKITDEDQERLMKQSLAMGRGFGFALQMPESAEAHYAGKGVKRDATDTPIFWYKPGGKTTYRVVYADLTVKDAKAAPQIEGAKRLQNASKGKKPEAF
ncbi:MAG TPA: hypothetical protein VGH74_18785 [Planctomycetaceae bacterium]